MNVREGLTPGDVIRVKATLAPPSGPALPGGYDFARTAWFLGLGATGYALGAPIIEQHAAEASLRGRFSDWLERLRQAIGQRIAAAIPGDAGAIATSLITGERGGISEQTNDTFRDSGLLHILSISGLHMVIMAGAVFASVRILLAAFPAIALRYPTKKWAAAAALDSRLGLSAPIGILDRHRARLRHDRDHVPRHHAGSPGARHAQRGAVGAGRSWS